jgi:hypothetical protein
MEKVKKMKKVKKNEKGQKEKKNITYQYHKHLVKEKEQCCIHTTSKVNIHG